MERAVELALIARYRSLQASGTGDLGPYALRVPASHYTDPEQTRAEVDALFLRGPLLVALTPDLPTPGSYLVRDVLERSILLTRAQDGAVRAFHNACRHRGARIAEGRGRRHSLTCPFHAWRWGLEGELLGRPDSRGGFDCLGDDFSALEPIAAMEVAGLIFVQLEGADIEAAVDRLMGAALADLAGYGIADTVFYEGREIERACNYKFLVDGFSESYHLPSLHRDSISRFYDGPGGLADPLGPVARNIGVRRSIETEFDKPFEAQRLLPHGTTQYLIPPNIVLCHQRDHIEFWQVFPVEGRADRCRIVFNLYWPAPMDEEARRKSAFNMDAVWSVTQEEDMPQALAIHRNLASGAIRELVFGRNEPSLVHYHEQIAAAIGSEALQRIPG